MAHSDIKYTHISVGKSYKKVYAKAKDVPIHNRNVLFKKYVQENIELNREFMESLSFNNIDLTLKRFTENYGVKFKKIDNNTWSIHGTIKKIKINVSYTRVRNAHAHIVNL